MRHQFAAYFCWFPVWLTFRSWRWSRHVPPKRQVIFPKLRDITTQKTAVFIDTAVRSWNPTLFEYSVHCSGGVLQRIYLVTKYVINNNKYCWEFWNSFCVSALYPGSTQFESWGCTVYLLMFSWFPTAFPRKYGASWNWQCLLLSSAHSLTVSFHWIPQ